MMNRVERAKEYRLTKDLTDEQIRRIFVVWAESLNLNAAIFPREQSIMLTRGMLVQSVQLCAALADQLTQTGEPELARLVRKLRRNRQAQN